MSEVNRYRFKGAAGEYIYSVDYEAALAREDAMMEELATSLTNEYNAQVHISEQHDKLTAAEQRNANQAETIKAYQDRIDQSVKDAYEWGYGDGQNNPNGYSSEKDRDACVAKLTMPTESGVSES
jgi:hypothetical protein